MPAPCCKTLASALTPTPRPHAFTADRTQGLMADIPFYPYLASVCILSDQSSENAFQRS
jgi:hypothetical protein